MLFMFLLFAASGVSDELWRERQEGTLRRILTTPGNLTAFLLGKVLAGVGFIGAILALALFVATWLYDLPWATFPVALLWLVLVAGLLIAMFGMVQLFAASRQGASLLLNLLLFPMMMLGGSFFPPESMPDWLVAIGAWTPNGYGLQVLKSLHAGSPDVSQVAVSFAMLGILTLTMLWFNSVLLRRRFAGEAS
jgi:ABC-type multidrug transport system permease subunit